MKAIFENRGLIKISMNLRLPEARHKLEQATIRNQEIRTFTILLFGCLLVNSRANPPTTSRPRGQGRRGGPEEGPRSPADHKAGQSEAFTRHKEGASRAAQDPRRAAETEAS